MSGSATQRDRRLTPANGRVAHVSLRGIVPAEYYVTGEPARILTPLTDLCAAPAGPRDRQLLRGAGVLVLDRQGPWAFVQSRRDGYVGWVDAAAIGQGAEPTHVVVARASHLYPEPSVRARELAPLSFGSELAVTGRENGFARLDDGHFVPFVHLRPIGSHASDPVAVTELLLDVPYLWGGNSSAGIDCSGLVQAACHACGIDCPGDSDLQRQGLGSELAQDAALRRGDILFWQGHVALVADRERIIHANAHSMSVAFEGIGAALDRIAATGTPLLARRRL